ncbi:MAG: 30S ribosomal protein S9 [Deltaproteobacteria bacterium HGW-Deltaproteobacteria-21]|jgi:small subunit ribosomal protein S9|nr:MAG: 30S ribosomal protein S9 [Deltaproteobacteria bacterium HGW-Deltaproteobacteria-21]PKN63539.1 MAG: 30S ribosomal protein S9 [Deltaproteobacteria bacterium HGW-Deltaproteobacteria-15]
MVERNQVVGKRKTAVARVWLLPGNGAITINRKPMDQYITREMDKILIRQPLVLTDTLGKYDIHVNVRGGGLTGQADAIRHGVSRALISLTPELRPILKKAHLLTRDSRVKERKKYGLRSARARYQYSKR